jgi:hypothetical protein
MSAGNSAKVGTGKRLIGFISMLKSSIYSSGGQ